jgi:hypothetical protein
VDEAKPEAKAASKTNLGTRVRAKTAFAKRNMRPIGCLDFHN